MSLVITHTCRFAQKSFECIKEYFSASNNERAAYAFGRVSSNGIAVIDPSYVFLLDDDCMLRQGQSTLLIDKQVMSAILVQFCRGNFNVLVDMHSHPFSKNGTYFSPIDDESDHKLHSFLKNHLEQSLIKSPEFGAARSIYHVSLVFDQETVAGRAIVGPGRGRFKDLKLLIVLGNVLRHIKLTPLCASKNKSAKHNCQNDTLSIRHNDFLDSNVQTQIADSTIGLIGAGGLGSIFAELFLRLGFRKFVIVDPDTLEESNLNRFLGGKKYQVGLNKVNVLANNLKSLNPEVKTTEVALSINDYGAISALSRCDLLIGGLDNTVARYFLNRLSVSHLIPYFDAGVVIDTDSKVDFKYRIVTVIPGITACLECTKFEVLNRKEIAAAMYDTATVNRMRSMGYLPDRPSINAPSVLPLNMLAASTLATEVLNFYAHFRPIATCIYGSYSDGVLQRSDRENYPETYQDECPSCGLYLGVSHVSAVPKLGKPINYGEAHGADSI